jgi:hypothetical protein
MLTQECLHELQSSWLPNITDAGLDRIMDMLQKDSPLLIHGCFTRSVPMGCLATHAAWNHPATAHLTLDAGVTWLYRVARLNPATSEVIREWDRRGARDFTIRKELLEVFVAERDARRGVRQQTNRIASLLETVTQD